MRKPSFKFAAMLGCTVALALSVLTAAQDIFIYPQEIETRFAQVETSRLNSKCSLRDRRLSALRAFLTPFLFVNSKGFTEPAKEEYRTRLAEAAARPCPPRIIRPKPAPVTPSQVVAATSPAPLPRTVTLEDLRLELAESCGARFEPARERFIAALDRAIRFETNARLRGYLERDRATVQSLKVPRCPPESAALSAISPSPRQALDTLIDQLNDACGDSWSVLRLRTLAALDAAIAAERNAQELSKLNAGRTALLRRNPPACQSVSPDDSLEDGGLLKWFIASAYLDRDLRASEEARVAGNCARRAAMLKSANEMLALMKVMGDSMPSSFSFAARLAAQELRPCPDPQNRVSASPVPIAPAPMSVPPSGILTPTGSPIAARNCTSIDRAKEPGELTCRCLGRAQTLSIWGSNPYRAQSSICNAAIHNGDLPASGMGMVRVIPVARARAALGILRNGIEASNWDFGFENAFTVAPGGADPDDSRPFDSRFMSGTFDTELGPMVLVNGRGTFGRSGNGSITPTRIAGPVLYADWEQSSALMARCTDGRLRGRVRFVFTGEGFAGLYASCDNNLNSTWNGRRLKTR